MRKAQLISGTPKAVPLNVLSKQIIGKGQIPSGFINHDKEFGLYSRCDEKPGQVLSKLMMYTA